MIFMFPNHQVLLYILEEGMIHRYIDGMWVRRSRVRNKESYNQQN